MILFVFLKAERDGKTVFHENWAMDAWVTNMEPPWAASCPCRCPLPWKPSSASLHAGRPCRSADPKILESWLASVRGLAQYMERLKLA